MKWHSASCEFGPAVIAPHLKDFVSQFFPSEVPTFQLSPELGELTRSGRTKKKSFDCLLKITGMVMIKTISFLNIWVRLF